MDSKSINRTNVLKSEIVSFDVTPAVERLSEKNFIENYGIIVQCVMTSGGQTHILDVFDFESSEKAILIIYTDDETSKNAIIILLTFELYNRIFNRRISKR